MSVKGFIGVMLLVLSFGAGAKEGAGPEVGQPSPNIMGRTLDDNSYRLKSDKGQAKVINFFSVTCVPCRKEMPELASLEKQYKEVKFISVHTEEVKAEVVAEFVKKLPGAPSNIVLTSGGLKEAFHFLGLPHTIVLDSDNIVLMNLVGYTPDNMQRLRKKLQLLTKH
ncbi:MAG: alkyl hydroperoxide reductase/thiol specific antioxidant/Mal [Gallionellaceae bacterium]|nr:MAG: alkyl hydroperoxide reductase/thiol specific antioxidant/Mal [Gallionellaceae bacterium]